VRASTGGQEKVISNSKGSRNNSWASRFAQSAGLETGRAFAFGQVGGGLKTGFVGQRVELGLKSGALFSERDFTVAQGGELGFRRGKLAGAVERAAAFGGLGCVGLKIGRAFAQRGELGFRRGKLAGAVERVAALGGWAARD
jgi:hypothetical protein